MAAAASRYTVILEVSTTGIGPTNVSTLGPEKDRSGVLARVHEPRAREAATIPRGLNSTARTTTFPGFVGAGQVSAKRP